MIAEWPTYDPRSISRSDPRTDPRSDPRFDPRSERTHLICVVVLAGLVCLVVLYVSLCLFFIFLLSMSQLCTCYWVLLWLKLFSYHNVSLQKFTGYKSWNNIKSFSWWKERCANNCCLGAKKRYWPEISDSLGQAFASQRKRERAHASVFSSSPDNGTKAALQCYIIGAIAQNIFAKTRPSKTQWSVLSQMLCHIN